MRNFRVYIQLPSPFSHLILPFDYVPVNHIIYHLYGPLQILQNQSLNDY